MSAPRRFSFTGRLRSVKFALRGLRLMLVSQHNAWVHAAATLAVCVAGAALRLSAHEWCCVVIVVVAVWTAEALNTALEFLCDVASPGFHPLVKNAKDVAAGAVLVSAIGSVVIGLLVLGPRVMAMVSDR